MAMDSIPSPKKIRQDLLKTILFSPSLLRCSEVWRQQADRVYSYQLQHNRVFHRWNHTKKEWDELKYLPIVAFKETQVCSFHVLPSSPWFESSGTTAGGQRIKSRHWFYSLDLYRASVVAGWKWFLKMRNFQTKQKKINFVGVMPSFQEEPHSSLSCMIDILMREFGDGNDFWCMKSRHWDWENFCAHLLWLEEEKQPSVLFGTAFGWMHFLDWCIHSQPKFRLPEDTLVLETGGYKGRSRKLKRMEFHHRLSRLLGVDLNRIRSEYSMCELSSQAYSFPVDMQDESCLIFRFPPWCRYRVIHPGSSIRVRKGEKGILEIQDLANLDSCAFLRTEDMVVERGNGFELVGRLPQSELKGCSLTFENGSGN